jgi:phage tail-like protein
MASTGTRRDPLPVYCFSIKLNTLSGEASAFFKSVSGLKYETEVTDYQEGGQNKFTHRLVGATKWSNITLKRGFAKSFDLVTWREEWINGKGKRISGEITQLDTKLNRVCSWEFKDGWPCKWELSEFDASKSELAIETLEIAHHGLTFKP